jgi:hypothetical protein
MNDVSWRAGHRRQRALVRSLLSGWALLVVAGVSSPAVSEPLYQVELLVFQPLGVEPAPASPSSTPSQQPPDSPSAIEPPVLPAGSLLLNDIVQRLDRSGRYRTLLHIGWRQNALQTQPMRVGDPPGHAETGVSGIASVKVGQQLAMQLSIACQVDGHSAWLKARRNIRVGELHYVDHRRCGALMQVTRVRDAVE